MTKPAVQRTPRSFWPEFTDLFSNISSWPALRQTFGNHVIKVEDDVKDGKYELLAEIPGVDPDKDVVITIRNGILTIKAERSEKKEANGRSEFSYGSFMRSVTLPAGTDEDAIKASYDKGILSVTVPIKGSETPEKHITIEPKS